MPQIKKRIYHKWNTIGGNKEDGVNLWQCPNCLVVKAADGSRIEYSKPDGEILPLRVLPVCTKGRWGN